MGMERSQGNRRRGGQVPVPPVRRKARGRRDPSGRRAELGTAAELKERARVIGHDRNMTAILRALCADITDLDASCVINAASTTPLGGGSVEGAIHDAARQNCSKPGLCCSIVLPLANRAWKRYRRRKFEREIIAPQRTSSADLHRPWHTNRSVTHLARRLGCRPSERGSKPLRSAIRA